MRTYHWKDGALLVVSLSFLVFVFLAACKGWL